MSPKTAATLCELRETMNAEFTVISDDGHGIRVLVQPGDDDLSAFVLVIDARYFKHGPPDGELN